MWNANYGLGTDNLHSETTYDGFTVGGYVEPTYVGADGPLSSYRQDVVPAFVPRLPDPSVGGEPGICHTLSYSTGIRLPRWSRQLMSGQVVEVPGMSVESDGPVGYSNRTNRLVYGANYAVSGSPIPTDSDVSSQFANAWSAPEGRDPNYG